MSQGTLKIKVVAEAHKARAGIDTARRSITDIEVARSRAKRKRNRTRRRVVFAIGVLLILLGTLALAILTAHA